MNPIEPIGIIRSPILSPKDAPIQPAGAEGLEGTIILRPEFTEGLRDLKGFSHIYLIYRFHLAGREALTVTPFMDTCPRGVFATRSPLRPNHIGLSIVQLVDITDNIITVKNVDVVDKTPLLDIKPYIRHFDAVPESSSGWMQAGKGEVIKKRSDDRFVTGRENKK